MDLHPLDQASAPDWLQNVWNIKTAEKIKVFIWKSLQSALPVGEQFAIRNIPVSPFCIRCNAVESIHHMLFTCPYASKVWDLAPLASGANILTVLNFQEGWERVRKIPSLPPMGIEAGTLAASIIWSLWRSRNNIIFEKRKFTPEETLQKALTDAREWIRAQPLPNPKISKPLIRLEPSPRNPDLCSIFTDAAWNPSTGVAGLGWVIDDLVSPSQHSAVETSVSSPLMAETLAVRTAMTFALSCRFESIAIFSDSQILINLITRKRFNQPNHKEDDEPRDLWSIEGYLPSIYRF